MRKFVLPDSEVDFLRLGGPYAAVARRCGVTLKTVINAAASQGCGGPRKKLRSKRADEMAARVAGGESQASVAKAYGVSRPAVLYACSTRGVSPLGNGE